MELTDRGWRSKFTHNAYKWPLEVSENCKLGVAANGWLVPCPTSPRKFVPFFRECFQLAAERIRAG